MLFMAWQSVHKAVAVVCMLDEILAVISEVTLAGITAVVGSDIAAVIGSPGHKMRGCRVSRQAVGQLSRV